jgi:deoxyribodipyrimidine photolyase-related protein
VEGFCRQLLGWREYVYGIYWAFMPEYRDRNARADTRELPGWFWTGQTDMNCLRQSLSGVVERGYLHHIQRLMVICNYATLTGLSPQAVNDWFYAMYIDSHDWVVTPNVVGMGMNADGGTMATKPYVSSGAYINRMSDYCKSCKYDVKRRTGEGACPFNYLFWTFLGEYEKTFSKNPRMTMMLKNYRGLEKGELAEMRAMRRGHLGS